MGRGLEEQGVVTVPGNAVELEPRERLSDSPEAGAEALAFERMLTQISGQLLGSTSSGLGQAVENGLRLLTGFFQVDRCALWERSEDQTRFTIVHEVNKSDEPLPSSVEVSCFPWFVHELTAARPLRLESLADLPADAMEERRYWVEHNLKSALLVPVSTGANLTGCFTLAATGAERRWPTKLIRRVQLAGEIFATAVARAKLEEAKARDLQFEHLLAEISTRFLNLPSEQVDREIEQAQRRLCECFGFDISTLWQWSGESSRCLILTHYYRRIDGPLPPQQMDAEEHFPWSRQLLLANQLVVVPSVEHLPPEASRDRETWRYYGVKTTLTIPLSAGGRPLLGALSFNDQTRERTWPEGLVKRLELVAQVFANALTRRKADDALRQSEERLSLAADSAGSGLWSLELRTNRFWITEKTREIFGFLPEALVTYDVFLSKVHPEDRERVQQTLQEMLQSGQHRQVEYRILKSDGTLRWVSARGRVHCTALGEPECVMGVTVDITVRKLVEETLKESEERFRTLVTNAGDGFELLDVTGQYIDVNPATLQQLGYTREEMLRMSVFDVDPLLTRDLFVQTTNALEPGAAIRVESVHRRKNGTTFPVEVTVSRIQIAGGARVLTLVRDITERKNAESLLRESESRFRTVADSAPVLIWMSGPDKLCHFFNQTWLDFTGRSAEQELGNGWTEGVHPEDLQSCVQAYVTAFDSRQPFEMQYRLRRHDGQYRWILDKGVPRYAAGGDFAGYIGSCADITEKKLAEEALLKSYAEIKELKDRLQAESDYLKEEIKVTQNHGEIVGNSRGIRKVLHQVEQVAATSSTVLITGETGTGKELIANAIHRASLRKDRVMVMVNCAALPPALVESELFGRERGAYTGALTRQAGRFEVAHQSTLFLDEIGELSLEVQAKLLRVLEVGEFERLGSTNTLKVNVRLVAATNRDLAEEVRKRRFREDLFYRLNVFPITIPPLRARAEDIPELVWAFVQQFSKRMGKKITKVSRKTMEALQQYHWPGNVRQLRNLIEHSVIISPGDTLRLTLPDDPFLATTHSVTLADHEREHILRTLESTGWRIKGPKGAAEKLGLKPSTLYTRMKKLKVPNRGEKLRS